QRLPGRGGHPAGHHGLATEERVVPTADFLHLLPDKRIDRRRGHSKRSSETTHSVGTRCLHPPDFRTVGGKEFGREFEHGFYRRLTLRNRSSHRTGIADPIFETGNDGRSILD